MKNLMCVLNPFVFEQTIYIFDGDITNTKRFAMENIDTALLTLAEENKIDTISLKGYASYCQAVKENIESMVITKYATNKIKVEIL